mmetsp:Transcript_14747/g.28279  ORF Transcript_14747/g.28279 Transcript_14747/m.28279 type:complete len:80 (+) Transcript_14747:427-666(+)
MRINGAGEALEEEAMVPFSVQEETRRGMDDMEVSAGVSLMETGRRCTEDEAGTTWESLRFFRGMRGAAASVGVDLRSGD